MHLSIEPQRSCAQTWLTATRAVDGLPGRSFHNVIMTVQNPCVRDDNDAAIEDAVNAYLRSHDKYPLSTVANTIFPEALYRAHGAPLFYDVYLKQVCTRRSNKGWGRYFERMISHPTQTDLNPLQSLIEKLYREGKRKGGVGNAFEMTLLDAPTEISIYDPLRDAKTIIGGQCLSFLSFHIGPNKQLLLTAVYRNHFYMARLLGNLIGLGRLQRFVAEKAGLEMGELTVISTHAEVDTVGSRPEISALLEQCSTMSLGIAMAAQDHKRRGAFAESAEVEIL